MKKKIVAMCATCAIAALAVGGTLAYFTDTDSAKNTFTVGDVSIVQYETNENGAEFVDGQELFPYTGEGSLETNDYGNVMDPAQNWISKIVTVKNDGSEDAYVRTLIAFQNLEDGTIAADPAIGDLAWRTQHGLWYDLKQYTASVYFPKNADGSYITYTNGDKTYIVGEYLYKMTVDGGKYDSLLKAGETTHPSLKSVALEYYVDNEEAAKYAGYEILVVSQAVQTEGFADANGNGIVADDALNTAFGDLATADQAKLAEWFANVL